MSVVNTSSFLSINWVDAGKSALVAALTALIATGGQYVMVWVSSPDLHVDKVSIILSLKAAFAAGLGDLLRRFLSTNKIVVTNVPEGTMNAVKAGASVKVDGMTVAKN